MPADTFDNVRGQFPIGFFVWRTDEEETFTETTADVYDRDGQPLGTKRLQSPGETKSINQWIKLYDNQNAEHIMGYMGTPSPDNQHNSQLYIANNKGIEQFTFYAVTAHNIINACVYLAVRQCIRATWLNDRDQFLWPKDTWMDDREFQTDCLAYALLHGQNRISSAGGTNHWIPFTEAEVDAKERFESHFMSDYIHGKRKPKEDAQGSLFAASPAENSGAPAPITFSPEARAVMDAGRELWHYYHQQPDANPNASFYDIRLHFQGTNGKGRMHPDRDDEQNTRLIKTLRTRLAALARKLAPKVYEHGFLMQ